ncbi:MAG TPA: ribulokinase [Polyangiaceae bacterium]|nr:ribulokinase [Polyangiaceae bacterium]
MYSNRVSLSEERVREDACVIGIDFGTDSVRCVVVDANTGQILASAVKYYPRWAKGLYCDASANQFRQHPLDYIESLESCVVEALAKNGASTAAKVRGIAVDTTGSTPALADASGQPLALDPRFADNPNAMFVLWKDHTSVAEAERLTELAHTWSGIDYTKYVGGTYSSEWFWAKALHILENDAAVAGAAVTLVEHCDWIPALLTGTTDLRSFRRSRCAAGHKALWHADFGGYPHNAFLMQLNPRLVALKETFGHSTFTSDKPFGTLSAEWAARLGLSQKVVVAVGAFDAHLGAVGAGIRPQRMVKVIGTSTCDIVVAPAVSGPEPRIAGICGQVNGSVIPGMIGYEAGQSAFGDVYAWFKGVLSWPLTAILPTLSDAGRDLAERAAEQLIPSLERAAEALPPEDSAVLALDWMNGRRTPDANQRLKGALTGISLGTDAPRLYRGLVEATAYGSRAIAERFREQGIRIDGAIAIGGVASKSPFVMQTVANVMNMEVEVPAGDQAVALGAAMFAATAAGLYPQLSDAQRAMSPGTQAVYRPDAARARSYDRLYRDYQALGTFVESRLREPSTSAHSRKRASHNGEKATS